MWKIQFICIVFLVVVSQIKADEIKLKNGEIIIGQIESEDETKITVLSGTGEKQDIKRGDIDEINYTPGGRIRLEKPSPATTAEPVQAILDNQVKPLPEWLDGDYRIQTKDGLVISRGRIISETDRIYWVAPYASDGDAYMVAIQKDRLLAPPQKLSSPPQKLLTSSPPPRARDGQPLMQNQDFWSGGRLSLQQSYMRDYSWYKSSRGAGDRGITAVSTHLAYEHSLVNSLKVFSMLVPGLRLEGSATRISSVQQYNDTVRVINGVTGGFGGTVTDSDSRTTTTGFTLSGGQLQGGLVWLFPFGNHRITVAPQMGFSVMSFEITSTNSAAAFTTSGIFGYEYAIGNVALAINARISHLATSEVSPITLLGGSFGLAYHISQ